MRIIIFGLFIFLNSDLRQSGDKCAFLRTKSPTRITSFHAMESADCADWQDGLRRGARGPCISKTLNKNVVMETPSCTGKRIDESNVKSGVTSFMYNMNVFYTTVHLVSKKKESPRNRKRILKYSANVEFLKK